MRKDQKINVSMTFAEFLELWDLCDRLENPEPLRSIIHRKAEALSRHELYSKSKTAKTEEEREKARQEYLDRVGMDGDFRWGKKMER